MSSAPKKRLRVGSGSRWALIVSRVSLAAAIGVAALALTGGLWMPLLEEEAVRLTDVLSETIETAGIDAALAQYRDFQERGFPGVRESESDTNRLGYRLLRKGELESALAVFELNVRTHPSSANVYDSLAEAHLAAGNRALAIENYRKAVALDPHKKTARAELRRLTGTPGEPHPPMLLFHILAGSAGLLAGAAAMFLRKGSRRHRLVGTVFFVSMLAMTSSAVLITVVEPNGLVINFLMGLLTFYLVVTAWRAARRRSGGTSLFDWGAMAAAAGVAAGLVYYGVEAASSLTGSKDGIGAGMYLFFGAVALLAASLDLRMIGRGGVTGAARIARHLWRMCFALLIAVMSLFMGQPQLFPEAVRNSGVLALPGLLLIVLMIFWLIRVLFGKAFRTRPAPAARTPLAGNDLAREGGRG